MADDVNLSALDKVRRLFGMPTLLEQMADERNKAILAEGKSQVASTAAPTAAAQNFPPPIPVEKRPGAALRENTGTLDFAMQELRNQENIRRHNAGLPPKEETQ